MRWCEIPPRGGLHSPRVGAVCASQTMTTLCRNRRGSIPVLDEETNSMSCFRRQAVRADEEWVTDPDREGVIYTLDPGAPPSAPTTPPTNPTVGGDVLVDTLPE